MNEITKIILTTIVSTAVSSGITAVVIMTKRTRVLFKSQCDQLRLQIHQMSRHCIMQGHITVAELEAITKAYESYHNLGGNGSITALYQRVSALELKEE